MFIAYDTKFHLKEEYGQPEIMAGVGGGQLMLSLSAHKFRVEYDDGKASIFLSRTLDRQQMRTLAAELVKAADELDRQEAEWHQSVQISGVPAGRTIVKIEPTE